MAQQRCLDCNLIEGDHRRSMLAVSRSTVTPVAGFKKNLYTCIQTGGPRLPKNNGQFQQGEGKFYRPQKQFS